MKRHPGLMLIVRRSLRQHALSTAITVLSVALASGLVMAVFAIKSQTYDAFTGGANGFDAVLGARGSQLQLVLNTVFHLETSPGNIPWQMYTAIAQDPGVDLAVPYAVGDNYQGYRIVGTTTELFTRFPGEGGIRIGNGGRIFTADAHEAVVGSVVAQRTGIKAGDTLQPVSRTHLRRGTGARGRATPSSACSTPPTARSIASCGFRSKASSA